MKETGREPGWLERPSTVNAIVYTIWGLCGLLLLAEFFYHKHPHFAVESWFGFYGFFGLTAYCSIVLSARFLRRFLARDENYYGEQEDD